MVKRMVVAAVLMPFVISLAPGLAHAAVLDPDETSGPFDLRWVDAAPTHHDRIALTVRFWPGFTGASLPQGHTLDLRRQVTIVVEGAPDGDFTNGAYHHEGYFFRHAGKLWLRNGEFGSSPCCWTTRSTRLDVSTLQVRFIPWWVRWGKAPNDIPIRFRVATRWCTDEGCVRDHTRWGYA